MKALIWLIKELSCPNAPSIVALVYLSLRRHQLRDEPIRLVLGQRSAGQEFLNILTNKVKSRQRRVDLQDGRQSRCSISSGNVKFPVDHPPLKHDFVLSE